MGALQPSKETEISSNNKSLAVSNQGQSGTCYAHSIATAIVETEHRIIGRCPSLHYDLVLKIVNYHELDHKKDSGASDTEMCEIIDWLYDDKRIKYNKIYNKYQIKQAIDSGRVVLATFKLSKGGWGNFSSVVNNPETYDYVLEKSDIDQIINNYNGIADDFLSKKKQKKNGGGHGVVITGYGIDKKYGIYWKIKNSWGDNHADSGYFRVMPDAFEFKMYLDIYYRVCDLKEEDINNYNMLKSCVDAHNSTANNTEKVTIEQLNKLFHIKGSCVIL